MQIPCEAEATFRVPEAPVASFCEACGNSITSDDKFCRVCGRVVGAGSTAPLGRTPAVAAGPVETSGKAIISLISGVLFFIPLLFVVAIIFGHLALSEIRKSARGRLKGEGMAMAGLVLGYLWLAGIPIILIVAAIAIPNLLRARTAANESSAVGSVRTLNIAETTYSQSHPEAGFTCSFADLAGSQLIVGDLASGRKNGYMFKLTDCSAENLGGPNVKYRVVAQPQVKNQTGVRAFCSDESTEIEIDSSGSAQNCPENGTPLQ